MCQRLQHDVAWAISQHVLEILEADIRQHYTEDNTAQSAWAVLSLRLCIALGSALY